MQVGLCCQTPSDHECRDRELQRHRSPQLIFTQKRIFFSRQSLASTVVESARRKTMRHMTVHPFWKGWVGQAARDFSAATSPSPAPAKTALRASTTPPTPALPYLLLGIQLRPATPHDTITSPSLSLVCRPFILPLSAAVKQTSCLVASAKSRWLVGS